MTNKSHFNGGHIAMNVLRKNGAEHSASIDGKQIEKSLHSIYQVIIRKKIALLGIYPKKTFSESIVKCYETAMANWKKRTKTFTPRFSTLPSRGNPTSA